MSVIKNLESILNNEEKRIRTLAGGHDLVLSLIELIRSVDFETYAHRITGEQIKSDVPLDKFRFGWSLPFRLLYEEYSYTDQIPLFEYDAEDRGWIDSLIHHSGSIEITRQILEQHKAKLYSLEQESETSFLFRQLSEGIGDEYYEKLSLAYYHSTVAKVLEAKIKPALARLPEIRKKLESIVHLVHERFIQYKATEEVEFFYKRLGYIMMMVTQIVDDLDESDTFGGIAYKDYLDFVEYGFMVGHMHRDCCFALAEKTKYKVNLRTILTYGFSSKRFFQTLSDYFGWDELKAKQIASCLAISKDNFDYHLSYPGLAPAPYFQLGEDFWMRSSEGCLSMPVFFLNRELKRKYPKDYQRARNRREARFKTQLYDYFKYDWIQCIEENIEIGTTDIDAVVFDSRKKVLALFQLKWQDAFSTSMKERRSRISNMIPKSVKWIDKVERWIEENEQETILKTCGIDDNRIEDIQLIVLSRNHIHFTNNELDDRATWGSWFQLFEASAKVKYKSNSNPIMEIVKKLRFLYPDMRREVEGMIRVKDTELKFANYKVKIKR